MVVLLVEKDFEPCESFAFAGFVEARERFDCSGRSFLSYAYVTVDLSRTCRRSLLGRTIRNKLELFAAHASEETVSVALSPGDTIDSAHRGQPNGSILRAPDSS